MLRLRAFGLFLFVSSLSLSLLPAARGATFTSYGSLYAAHVFPPNNFVYVYNESYFATGFAATGGGKFLNDQAESVEGTSLNGQANSLTGGGVLQSHAYAQLIRSVGTTNTPNRFEIAASATSDMTISDVIVSGGPSATFRLNLDLHGGFSTGTMFVATEWMTTANNYVGVSVFVNGTSVGYGEYRYVSTDGSAPVASSSGMLVGFDGSTVLQTNPITVSTSSPVTIRILLQTAAGVAGPTQRGLNLGANTDFGSTLTFATSGPVFTFTQDGFTANSAEGGIVDNSFAVPEPATALPLLVAGSLALRRRRGR